MSAAPDTIYRPGPLTLPFTYQLGTTEQLRPHAVFATVDGTAASGQFYIAVSYFDQLGVRVARAFPSTVLAAGASADVSWFHGVAPPPTSSAGPGGLVNGCRVSNRADQTIANATWTRANFGAVDWSFGAVSWSAGTPNVVTVSQAGVYVVLFSAIFGNNATGTRYAALGTNGNLANVSSELPQYNDVTGATNYTVQTKDVLLLNAGDTISAWVFQNSGGNLAIKATAGSPPGGVFMSVAGWSNT